MQFFWPQNVNRWMKANKTARENISKFSKEVKSFIEEVDTELKASGIELYLSSGSTVKLDCGACSGYYDSANKRLAVATGMSEKRFISVACHELSHKRQQDDLSSIWHDPQNNENYELFFQWLKGKKHPHPEILVQAAIKLELDCEKRSIKLIRRKFSHIINPLDYIRASNAYLFGHLFMLQKGCWFKKTLYLPQILESCPDHFCRKYEVIPPKLAKVFDLYL